MAGVGDLDLYGVLGVAEEATKKEIVKAYRKQALKCHPDKNPDNPKAAELFHQLSRALEVLTDVPARAAYDKIQKAKKAAQLRNKELDSKRKKFKEDLEAREKAAVSDAEVRAKAQRNLQAEIERLRKEGSTLLEEEQQRLAEELKQQNLSQHLPADEDTCGARIKVRWSAKKNDPSNGGYNSKLLSDLFGEYGEVSALIVSSKRNGSAIVEYTSYKAANLAVESEFGFNENPLKITWLSTPPDPDQMKCSGSVSDMTGTSVDPGITSVPGEESSASSVPTDPHQSAPSDTDFESVVLMRLRQAEERKRLIEEMEREDAKS